MAEVPDFVLYEHAVGYALLKVKEFEDAALIAKEVTNSVWFYQICSFFVGYRVKYLKLKVDAAIPNVQKFSGIIKMHAFEPFRNTENALENCNSISEGMYIRSSFLIFME